jgi:hypothetical protein
MFIDTQNMITKWAEDNKYIYSANGFSVGDVYNDLNGNQWSAKILSYAKINNLSLKETLNLFEEHYQDVLNNPNVDTHKNIRALIKNGLEKVKFDKDKLVWIKK